MFWEERITEDSPLKAGFPYWARHCVISYGARTLRGGESWTFHAGLWSARTAAFFAVLRGDQEVVVLSIRTFKPTIR